MDHSYSEKGVFLSSESLDSTLLVGCLQSLLSDYPTMRFTSITADEKLRGFRILFTGADVAMVLDKKQLVFNNVIHDRDDFVSINPLTTVIIIQDVGVQENPLFEYDMLEAVALRFGKVLDVIKFDSEAVVDKNFKNSLNENRFESRVKKWRVRVDIPEDETLLEVSKKDPKTIITLPKWNKKLRVSFLCRHCKLTDHFRRYCERLRPDNGVDTIPDEISEDTIVPRYVQSLFSSPVKNTEEPKEILGNISSELIDNCSDDEEKLAKKARNSYNQTENLKISKEDELIQNEKDNMIAVENIKKEVEDDDDDLRDKTTEISSDNNSPLEHPEDGVLSYMSFEDDTQFGDNEEDSRKVSNSLDQNENSNEYERKVQQVELAESNSRAVVVLEKLKSIPSGLTPPPPRAHTVLATSSSILGAADTSILSDELQGYINRACEEIGALDRETLDAFLGYVKKKNKPTHIALKYTPNVKQLKDQLQMILTLRYHSKPTNQSKEDAVFIKWLEGLVSRFDNNAPSKRKRP